MPPPPPHIETSQLRGTVTVKGLISETKIDSSFPTAQFQIDCYATYRLEMPTAEVYFPIFGRHTIRNAEF